MFLRTISLVSVVLLLNTSPAFAFEQNQAEAVAAAAPAPITRFYQVSPGIYRGARPSLEALKYLAKNEVKTILNLEDDSKQVAWEKAEAEKLGMRYISTPMSGFWRPKTPQVQQSLKIVGDRSLYPIFIHCKHGEDRTGLITGLFRVFHQGWEPAVAYQEMRAKGFHPALAFLDQYYIDATGYSPYPTPNY